MEENKNNEELVKEAYYLVDNKMGTVFEKSRTAFLSFSTKNGSITLSAFLARAMGIVSGDRIALITSKENKLRFLIIKTRQRQGSAEVRINRGVYKVNNLKWVRTIQEAFRFNPEYTGLIRLYINMENPVTMLNMDGAKALQLYDMPLLREDFATEEEKQEYVDYVDKNPYIINVKNK